jgi:hypothetical protein
MIDIFQPEPQSLFVASLGQKPLGSDSEDPPIEKRAVVDGMHDV